ncbi:retention module-containing protein [Agarivorans sp. 1_MG-2023]|uniref:retention module-containing protein n=1 Tax=Agarivorans sp. 1_MG-2023 TaxID=3062634 RepID=UPI0026E2502A|nr:retention module-containing protein [Agarivorans sp. 1_MG-2023]MDO6764470.1 retention module-containing protein [Agarivorans sp. 1_MG-2023]
MEQSIATSNATIVSIQGQAFAVDAQGNIRSLQPGDSVVPGEMIITSQGAQLGFYYGEDQYLLGDNSATQLPNVDIAEGPLSAANDLDVDALQQAILEGADPTELFEATAAGGAPTAADGEAAGNGGFITIDRVGGETIAQTGFDTQAPQVPTNAAQTDSDTNAPEPLAAIDNSQPEPSPPAPSPDQAPTITLTAGSITEDLVDADTVIASFTSNDADGDVLNHSLLNDTDGFFVIDGNEIKLSDAGIAAVNNDQLNLTTLNLTIQVEANGLTASDSASVEIVRVDDEPATPVDQAPTIDVVAQSVTEDAVSTDTVVANFTSNDPDGDVQTYQLLNNDDGYFVLDGNQVKLTADGVAAINNDSLNLTSLDLTVQVEANGLTAADSDLLSIVRVDDEPSTPEDQAPTIDVVAQSVTEDAVSTDTIVANFTSSDPDGDVQTYMLLNNDDGYFVIDGNQVKLTADGVAAINNDSLNLTSLDLTVQVEANGLTATDSDTLSIVRVDDEPSTPVDQAPTIDVVAQSVTEDAVSTDTIVANFTSSDPDGDVQTYQLLNNDDGYFVIDGNQVKLTADGVAAVNSDALNLSELSINVQVSANGQTAADSDIVNVVRVNDAPDTDAVVLTPIAEDSGARTITSDELLASAGDIESDDLTVSNLQISAGSGSLVNNNDGTWTYTPAANDDTEVSFSYDITDNGSTDGASDPQTVSGSANLDITPVNDAPETDAVVLTPIAEDSGARTITSDELLASAGDIEGDDLTISNLQISAGSGSLVNNNDGTWTYTPAANDDTEVSFSYDITDNGSTNGASDPQTVSGNANLDITPVNDAPETDAVVLTPIAEDSGARTITSDELLASAGDIEGDDLTISNLQISAGSGSLVNNNDGTWTYTPAANDDTEVSFSYDITDNGSTNGASDPQTVSGSASLDITPVNDAPETDAVVLTPIAEDSGARTITSDELLASAGDIEGDDLTISNLQISAGSGSLVNNNDGTWTYTPAANDDTEVSFSYDITDNGSTNGASDPQTVSGSASLDITPVNDAPETDAVVLTPIAEDSSARTITSDELLASAADIEGDDLTVSNLQISVGSGSLVNNNDGTWTYTPAANDDTEVSFSYDITDNGSTNGASDPQTVGGSASLDLRPDNDAPDAQDDDFSNVAPSESVQLDLLANDSDLEGDAISIKSINGTELTPRIAQDIAVANGVVNVTAAGVISFTANADGNGAVDFNYVLQDEFGAESSASVSGNVVDLVNDSAQVFEAGLDTGSDAGVAATLTTGNLLSNDGGVVDGLAISSIGYDGGVNTADVNGVISFDTEQGSLTVYTEDYNGFFKGDYEYQLNSSSLNGDGVTESFDYVVSNPAEGFATQGKLEVSIVDDAPVGSDVYHNLASSPLLVTTNLVLVLDTSASMTNGGDYLGIAVEALSGLIEQADSRGNVNVQVIGFSESVKTSGWISDDVSEAISFLESLNSGGGTHYDLALNEVIATSTSINQPLADNTLLYFISDGEPTSGHGVDDTVEYEGLNGLAAWDSFVENNLDTSYGIGIGDADLGVLEDVASESATDEFAFIVEDVNDLSVTLIKSYLDSDIEASLGLFKTASTNGFMVGADEGYVSTITIETVSGPHTYYYDPYAEPQQAKNINITTALGGLFLLDFSTGAYSYELDVDSDGWGKQESLEVSVTDLDGDSHSIDIEISTIFEAAVDANRDVIITNQDGSSTISVPSLALLWNDTGEEISLLEIDNVVGGSVAGSDEILFSSIDDVGLGIHDSNFETEDKAITGSENENDSELNGLNNSLATAVDLTDRSLFSSNDADFIQLPNGYSYSFKGSLASDSDATNGHDQDWLKISLAKGEKIWANMDPVSGQPSVKTDLYLYDKDGKLITKFGENWQGPKDGYEAQYEGEYYFQIVADNPSKSGDYQLYLTIDVTNADYVKKADDDVQEQFDYTIIDDTNDVIDTATAELIGVHGNSVDGRDGDEVLVGNESANTITGEAGDDALVGYAGDDQLEGGEGADLLIGGQGNDVLIGGDDSDMFAWLDGDDQGTINDTINDFTLKDDSDPNNAPDVLNLSDLLQGETEASLESYLSFETISNGGAVETIISIDKDGGANGESVHQTITLKDVDFSGMSDNDILTQLIEDQQLNVDN